MYFTAYQSRKRERSPPSDTFATPCNSPAIGLLTSPTVDVLAKRQRTGRSIGGVLEQIEVQDQHLPALQYEARANGNASNSNGNGLANGNGHERELDMSMQYAEKRRARQWEQLNAPQPVSPLFKTPSHPPPGIYDRLNPDNEDLGYFSPAHAHHAQKPSRPQFKHHMSSSPIRHQPPGSSPFKSSAPSSQATARDFRSSGPISAESEDEDEEMDQEELRRDWGEHYARPNGLLLSLVSCVMVACGTVAHPSTDHDRVNLVYLLHLTTITRTICSRPHLLDLPRHEHIATETSMTWALKSQKMPDHRLTEGMSAAKSTINMKRPIDSLVNLSLFGDSGLAPNELVIAINNQTRYTFNLSRIRRNETISK